MAGEGETGAEIQARGLVRLLDWLIHLLVVAPVGNSFHRHVFIYPINLSSSSTLFI